MTKAAQIPSNSKYNWDINPEVIKEILDIRPESELLEETTALQVLLNPEHILSRNALLQGEALLECARQRPNRTVKSQFEMTPDAIHECVRQDPCFTLRHGEKITDMDVLHELAHRAPHIALQSSTDLPPKLLREIVCCNPELAIASDRELSDDLLKECALRAPQALVQSDRKLCTDVLLLCAQRVPAAVLDAPKRHPSVSVLEECARRVPASALMSKHRLPTYISDWCKAVLRGKA